MSEKPREWTKCAHCNRVLWVGDKCDCPDSHGRPAKALSDQEKEEAQKPAGDNP